MDENELPLWEQQPGETARQFAHFRAFLLLGPDRTVLAAYRRHRSDNGPPITSPVNAVPQTWRENARELGWHRRAVTWDREQSRLEENRRLTRIEEQRESEWRVRQKFLSKLDGMLNFPLARTITGDGTTTLEPARWTLDTAAKFAQVASDLGRRSCDMETLRVAHEIEGLDEDELNEQAALALVALLREGKLPREIVAQIERAVQSAKPADEGEIA
jgi:hypothetical protein